MLTEAEELLEMEWAGTLDQAGRLRLEALAAADTDLAARLQAERHLTELLDRCGPSHAPLGLSRSVLRQLANEKSVPAGSTLKNWLTFSRWSPALHFCVGAAVVFVFGGVIIYQQHIRQERAHFAQQAKLAQNKHQPLYGSKADSTLAMVPQPVITPGISLAKAQNRQEKPLINSSDKLYARPDRHAVSEPPQAAEQRVPEKLASPSLDRQIAAVPQPALDRAVPIPSPTPAPTSAVVTPWSLSEEVVPENLITAIEHDVAMDSRSSALKKNDPRHLPVKMQPNSKELASDSADLITTRQESAVAASIKPAAAVPIPANVEMEIRLVAAAPPLPAAANLPPPEHTSSKMNVRVQAFAGGDTPGALFDSNGAGRGASTESLEAQPVTEGPLTGVHLKDVTELLTSAGATQVDREPYGTHDGRAWKLNCSLTRSQLHQFIQSLRKLEIEPALAPGHAVGTYFVQSGQSVLAPLGKSLTAGQQQIKLHLLVHE